MMCFSNTLFLFINIVLLFGWLLRCSRISHNSVGKDTAPVASVKRQGLSSQNRLVVHVFSVREQNVCP
jgi:flagellar biogenesis protein FliO